MDNSQKIKNINSLIVNLEAQKQNADEEQQAKLDDEIYKYKLKINELIWEEWNLKNYNPFQNIERR